MKEGFSVRKKTVGSHIITGAVLAVLGISSVHAATLPVFKEPVQSQAPSDRGSARIIVRYKDTATRDQSMKVAMVQAAAMRANLAQTRATGKVAASPLRADHMRTLAIGADLIKLSRKLDTAELDRLLAELAADPSVKYAEVDVMDRRAATPNDEYYAQYQWHLNDPVGGINVPAAWDLAQGEGVVVAVLDTGILPAHPDINVNLLQGYDFITDTFVSRRATTDRVPGAQDYGDWNDDANECEVGNSSWHGTHVAGTIGEATHNGIGMAGVAYKSIVLPVRVLGRCGGYRSDITDAMVWASGGTVPGVPDNANPAEVINMSLGGAGSCGASYQEAIDIVVSRGTTVVVAAGNDAADAANHSPSSCASVISVGASRSTGGRASYSNYGATVDIAAPGGGGTVDGAPGGYIWQHWYSGATTPTSGNYSYIGMAGTSMASPHVAGVVALVQEESCTQDCSPVAIPLTNKVPIAGVTGYAGLETLYSFEAQAGAVLSVLSYGGTGNMSLYASFGKEPTAAGYDAKSTRPGNNETLRFTAPKPGTYFIKVVGEGPYGGVTLEARQ